MPDPSAHSAAVDVAGHCYCGAVTFEVHIPAGEAPIFTAYCHCLRAVNLVLSKDFSLEEKAAVKPPLLEQSHDFLKSLRQEMEIEGHEQPK